MSHSPVLAAALGDTEFQVVQVFAGLEGSQWDHRATPQAMTPLETLEHLTECCIAMESRIEGLEHQWGSYKSGITDPIVMMAEWKKRRKEVTDVLDGTEDEILHIAALNYLSLHEAYHVGQMALCRRSLSEDWNPYSIYPG